MLVTAGHLLHPFLSSAVLTMFWYWIQIGREERVKLTICATLPRFNPSQAQVMTPHYSAQLQVLWRWTSGEATAQDIGSPSTGSTQTWNSAAPGLSEQAFLAFPLLTSIEKGARKGA